VWAIAGLWRWRRNPLRRGTDLAEALVALTAAFLFILAAPVTGWLSGEKVDSSLQHTVRLQHEQRHLTTAVVTGLLKTQHPLAYNPKASPDSYGSQVVATWKAANGTAHNGVLTAPGRHVHKGNTFRIWADQQGRLVKSPMNGKLADINAGVAGLGSALLAAVFAEFLRRIAVWQLVQRRYHRLDRAWARLGPDWGRTGAGS
jgi:hypothetical protein